MDLTESYRRRLLDESRSIWYDSPISDATAEAFLATPRHLFVRRYRQWGTPHWHEVTADNLREHLAAVYANHSLIISGDDDDDIAATISEPSFVLRMLDMLQLRPEQSVFELGTGSGWNAALIARLVGPHGRVYSLEIIPELTHAAADSIERLGIRNVHVITADGADGYVPGAPYDRAVFTAGTYDIPRAFHEQVKDGGLLLAVLKNEGGGDSLFLLRRAGDCFASLDAMTCGFVQLRGKHRVDHLDPIALETLPEWNELRGREISRKPFWWGGKGRDHTMWRTAGIRSFLGIVEPAFKAFKTPKSDAHPREEHFFGIWMANECSLVLARDDALISYGTPAAEAHLLEHLRCWIDLGMPSAASLCVRVYPGDARVSCSANQWLVRRPESQFLWSLPA